MKNPATLTGTMAVLVAVGFAAGYGIGQRRAVEEGRLQTSTLPSSPESERRPAAASADPSRVGAGTAESDRKKLHERIVELETELQIARDESAKPPLQNPDVEVARKAFEDLLAMEAGDGQSPDRLHSLISSLAKLDARTARPLIERFRNAPPGKPGEQERNVALKLALMSGGPDAADFIHQLLTEQDLEPGTRDTLLSEISPRGGSLFSIRRLPVGAPLAAVALRMVHSGESSERNAGASLLGGVRSDESRSELLRLLEDSQSDVREGAARSLGMIGDGSTRKILESYAAQTKDEGLRHAAAAAIKVLDQAPR